MNCCPIYAKRPWFYAKAFFGKENSMPRKVKGELPSGSIRRQVFDHSEPLFDADGNPMIDPKTGKQKRKRYYKSITASSRSEAEAEKQNYLVSEKKRQKSVPDMTLREAIEKYISASDALLSPTTIHGYRTIQKFAFSDIMDIKLSRITNQMLREAVNRESKRNKLHCRKPTPISPKTVINEYGLITAVLNEYTSIDCTVKLPAKINHIKELPTPSEIFLAVKGTNVELPVLLAMWLSFSMSEIRGLKKSSVVDGYITINQVVVSVNGQDIEKKQAKQFTRTRRHRIPEYIQRLIDAVETEYLVPMNGKLIRYYFDKYIRAAGLRPMTFHDLRHVNASVMAALHIPDKYAQERGGWKTDKVMKSVYTHTFSKERQLVDDKIDAFFDSVVGEKEVDKKYLAWLVLFDLQDTKENAEKYKIWKMQHEMQHEY